MTSTGPVRPLVGTFVLLGSILGAHLAEGGYWEQLAQPIGALLVIGGTLGMIVIGCGLGGPMGGLRALLFGSPDDQTDFGSLRRALYLVIHGAPLAGFAGTVVGLIHVMQNLSDPTQVGSGMAVALVALFYGVIMAMIAYGFVVMVDRRDGGDDGSEVSTDAAEAGSTPGQAVVGTGIVLVSIIGAYMLEGGDPPSLLSGVAGLAVGGATLGTVLIPGGVPVGQSALRGTLRLAIQAAMLAGLVGAILGTIDILGHLDDPSRLGSGVALAYLALFYGTITAMIAHGWLARAGGGSEGAEGLPAGYAVLYAAGGFSIVMMIFLGILAVLP